MVLAQALVEKGALDAAISGASTLFNHAVDFAEAKPYVPIVLIVVVFFLLRRRR